MRITTHTTRDGALVAQVHYEYRGVEKLLKDTEPNNISVIWGASSYDEFLHFTNKRKMPLSARCILNRQTISYHNFGFRSGLYAKSKYRIESFLRKDVATKIGIDKNDGIIFVEPINFALSADKKAFDKFITSEYINSKRVIEGAIEEAKALIRSASLFDYSGPVIINIGSSFNYADLICAWHWKNSASSTGPLILCTSWKGSWVETIGASSIYEAEYIPRDELISCVQLQYQMSEQTVQTAFRIWKNSLDQTSRKLAEEGKITRQTASRFASAVADSNFENEQPKELQVPTQRPAPLRFRSEGTLLDILPTREHSPDEARVKGSARTCLTTATDMAEYGGFSNTIPGFMNKIKRLTDNLHLVESGSYDDALIIQLGTETSALELRIWASKE